MAGGRELYLDLMKRVLVNSVYEDPPQPAAWNPGTEHDPSQRHAGRDWPSQAHTMVGRMRLDNVQHCVERVIEDGVPGDLIETGVWRGGVCILMRAVLKAHGVTDRTVWVADSFQGIPVPDDEMADMDRGLALHEHNDVLAISEATVRENFDRYGLLDEQVRFLPGWFKDTLPDAPIERLAVLRLDGDLYGSTMDTLTALYAKLSPGGFVIVDDYSINACFFAVRDFREREGIQDPIEKIDQDAVFWRKG